MKIKRLQFNITPLICILFLCLGNFSYSSSKKNKTKPSEMINNVHQNTDIQDIQEIKKNLASELEKKTTIFQKINECDVELKSKIKIFLKDKIIDDEIIKIDNQKSSTKNQKSSTKNQKSSTKNPKEIEENFFIDVINNFIDQSFFYKNIKIYYVAKIIEKYTVKDSEQTTLIEDHINDIFESEEWKLFLNPLILCFKECFKEKLSSLSKEISSKTNKEKRTIETTIRQEIEKNVRLVYPTKKIEEIEKIDKKFFISCAELIFQKKIINKFNKKIFQYISDHNILQNNSFVSYVEEKLSKFTKKKEDSPIKDFYISFIDSLDQDFENILQNINKKLPQILDQEDSTDEDIQKVIEAIEEELQKNNKAIEKELQKKKKKKNKEQSIKMF